MYLVSYSQFFSSSIFLQWMHFFFQAVWDLGKEVLPLAEGFKCFLWRHNTFAGLQEVHLRIQRRQVRKQPDVDIREIRHSPHSAFHAEPAAPRFWKFLFFRFKLFTLLSCLNIYENFPCVENFICKYFVCVWLPNYFLTEL